MAKISFPWEKLEKLKKPHKLAILFGTVALFGALFFFLLLQPLWDQIAEASKNIGDLEQEINKLTTEAKRIPETQKRLAQLRVQDDFLRTFLPEKKEVAQLLRNISNQGAGSGLNVVLFQPREEKKEDFYAEIPFEMKVEGPYLNVAQFFYRLGRLERIVNVDDVRMGTPKLVEGDMVLATSCTGKTFRFLTKEEIEAQKEAKKAAAKKGAAPPKKADEDVPGKK